MPIIQKLFVSITNVAPYLPKFKGKDGAFLRLFNILGLGSSHIIVDTTLRQPVKYRVRVDLHSWLQRLAFVSGEYEADTVKFLIKVRNSLKRDGYILDIGANIGLIGIPAAMIIRANSGNLGEQPLVVCIEAVTDNEKALRHNISLNDANNYISVIGTGLGEMPGVVEIQVEGDLANGEGTGTANILPKGSTLDPNGTYHCVSTSIQITTLDILSEENALPNNCTLVKIDTDGYDLKILEGGRNFLMRNRPVIYGEFMEHCLNWHGESIEDVVKFAHSIDYVVWQRQAGKIFKFTDSINLSKYAQDALLIPIENTHALTWCCE